MTQFEIVQQSDAWDGDTLVVLTATGADGDLVLLQTAAALEEAFGGSLAETLTLLGAKGAEGEVVRCPTLGAIETPLVVALGTSPTHDTPDLAERLRRAAGTGARVLEDRRDVVVLLPDDPEAAAAVCEGWQLGAHAFTRYKTDAQAPPQSRVRLAGAQQADLARANALAEVVALCRDLVSTPASDLTPEAFAAQADVAAKALGLEVEIWDDAALVAGGFGGLVNVGKGSTNPPRLVRIAHPAPPAAPTVALVGKGITFDSGGLSLKESAPMATMKGDMAGAAAVLATVLAAARLDVGVGVTAWLPLAENMPGGRAMRPSDVIRIYGGTTVEVMNTDAEGRLVLADAITRAGEEAPDAMIDVATLTGAHVPAVGSQHVALVANDDALSGDIAAAGDLVGEPMCPLPLVRTLRPAIDSPVADLRNIGEPGVGRIAVSALFLESFVPSGLPWAHLDIAGPSSNRGESRGYHPKGPTGVPVRTLVAYLEALATRA